jgi:hypothetical protein
MDRLQDLTIHLSANSIALPFLRVGAVFFSAFSRLAIPGNIPIKAAQKFSARAERIWTL